MTLSQIFAQILPKGYSGPPHRKCALLDFDHVTEKPTEQH